MVGVVGISTSSRAEVELTSDRLGTNLVTVAPGETLLGGVPAPLPVESVAMIGRVPPVTAVSATGAVAVAHVYRNDRVPIGQHGAIAVPATNRDLLDTDHCGLSRRRVAGHRRPIDPGRHRHRQPGRAGPM